MELLALDDLSQDYEDLPVVRNISLSLQNGEHLAILGPSGCGKSTLLRMVTGLDRPSNGSVRFKGKDVTGKTGVFGFMSQQDLLLPWRPLWENVALPLLLKGTKKADAKMVVQTRLETFGLGRFSNFYPHQLSGGMRQRAAFLRTSLANPELFLLDEPFAALDVLTRLQMQEWLYGVLEKAEATLVLVTHSVEEALLLANRVVVLSPAPGRVVLDESVPYANEPFETKAYRSDFLEQKRRISAVLKGELYEISISDSMST